MNLQQAVKAARAGAALFDLSWTHGLITVEGPDRERFLQSLTTNDVESLSKNASHRSALLDTKSRVIADFHLHKFRDSILLLAGRPLVKPILEILDKFHFAEEVSFATRPATIVAVQGEKSGECLAARIENFTELEIAEPGAAAETEISGAAVRIVNRSFTGDEGYLVLAEEGAKESIIAALSGDRLPQPAIPHGEEVLEILRIEAGYIMHGKDFDTGTLLLELNLGERIFSKVKGCYPGQEVLARVLSRGRIARMLTGLTAEEPEAFAPGKAISHDGKKVGIVKSTTWSPTLGKAIAIANLKRDFTENGAEFSFEIDGRIVGCTVTRLPFYLSPRLQEEAQRRYQQGMQQYHDNRFDNARDEFEKAIAIDENYADAWEALAMTLEKMGELDEAIRLNRRYAELDPLAVMAHTNLSRLYMLKGFRERAEEEQGKATLIQFRLQAGRHRNDSGRQRELEEKQENARRAESERKLAIFRQVLEMDPEDEIANFGAGKIYLEMGEYDKSINALRKVIVCNEKYSAAYELLARALIEAGEAGMAKEILAAGITIAESNGDLMPMKSMQALLASLSDGETH